jgi:hypothetical protein
MIEAVEQEKCESAKSETQSVAVAFLEQKK